MAHFSGDLFETTPLKPDTGPGGDDLSVSELSSPQYRWMGDGVAPATPDRHDEGDSLLLRDENEQQTFDPSYDESLRFGASALDDGDDADNPSTPRRAMGMDADKQLLDKLKYDVRAMNKSVIKFNDFLRACIPKYQRLQQSIDNWDGLSKQYNQIIVQAENNALLLEDPTWMGKTLEEGKYLRFLAEEEERQQEEEQRRIEREREEQLRQEKEKAKQSKPQPSVRGNQRGRASAIGGSLRGTASRGSGIARGASSVSGRPSSIPLRGSSSSGTRGRFG